LGQRYLLVVTCHDTGRLVWAGKDRNQHTLGRFFDDLGAERAAALTHVSADGAEWIHDVVTARAPRAQLCPGAFHVVAWATEALDPLCRAMVTRLCGTDRHGRPHPRRPLPTTPRTIMKISPQKRQESLLQAGSGCAARCRDCVAARCADAP
jgi:transposase